MTAYVRSGVNLAKRRRVLDAAERGLRAAIQHGAVKPHHVERVRDAQLSYLKALRYELSPGTEVDDATAAKLRWATDADRAWQVADVGAIVAAYASGVAIAPGRVPATTGRRND